MHRLIFLCIFLYVCYIVLWKENMINGSLLSARIILRLCEGRFRPFTLKFWFTLTALLPPPPCRHLPS